jgi:hypothetical protein
MKRQHPQTAMKSGAKKSKVVGRVQQGLNTVAAALQQGPGLSAEASAMLWAMLPNCLGVEQDVRHKYQSGMVEVVAEELAKIESSLKDAIEVGVAAVAATAEEKASLEATLNAARAALEAEQALLDGCKAELAQDALTFRGARADLNKAETEQHSKSAEVDKAGSKRSDLEGLLADMETVHERKEEVGKLLKRLHAHLTMDSSLETAMPSAMAKAAADRGPFDVMVFDQVRGQAAARLSELTVAIEAAAPLKAELAAAVAKASAALAASKEKQVASASAYSAQKAKTDAAAEAVKAAQAGSKDAARRIGKVERVRDSAQAELDIFRQDALASFTELRDRATPAPEPQEEAAEAADAPMEQAAEAVAVA